MDDSYDSKVLTSVTPMVGHGSQPATQEIHLFLAKAGQSPVNPTEEVIQEYMELVDKWNNQHGLAYTEKFGDHKMKPCHLCLIFRQKETHSDLPVRVMQTATYCKSNSMAEIIAQSHAQTEFFKQNGFDVVREKIEATAYGIDGIPQTKDELPTDLKTYFEFHIKTKCLDKSETDPMSVEEEDLLKKISAKFTVEFGSPVPLSYNINRHKEKDDGLGSQRFLNVRFRSAGMTEIKDKVDQIKTLIDNSGVLKVVKVISEYVWYDTLPGLDAGWIDFSPEEEVALMTYLKSVQNDLEQTQMRMSDGALMTEIS
jgi:hypothetical protein